MTLASLKKTFIGDKAFYHTVFTVAVPIIVQNGITNFVSLLDNIMVGQVGTEPMSGVAIVNQLIFVYALCIFGGLSGAGIFSAQFYGRKDHDGLRYTFRYKLMLGVLLTVLAVALLMTRGERLISLYLNQAEGGGDLQATLHYGMQYLRIMLIGLPPFMLLQTYAGTLRECGETLLPMKAGITAVLVNLVFNYLLIYGKFGFPQLGVEGAAIATVLSRYVEAAIVMLWTHRHHAQHPYFQGAYRSMCVPMSLVRQFILKGSPLLINEALWSSAMATLNQCYSIRGLNVVAATNIASTILNLFNVVFLSMGSAVAILVGQKLGAGRMDEARDADNKLIAFSLMSSVAVALVFAVFAPLLPRLYNTSAQVRMLATQLMLASAVFMPQSAFMNASYFTLRSGGKTVITFIFDSVCLWVISIPIAYLLSRYTDLYVVWIFVLVQVGDWIKCVVGYHLVKRGIWMHDMTRETGT